MKNLTKLTKTLFPLVFTALLSTPALSQSGMKGGGEHGMHQGGKGEKGKRGGKRGFMKKLKELNLTEDQMQQIKEIKKAKKDGRQDKKAKREEIRKLKTELVEKLKSSASTEEVRALNKKIKELHMSALDSKFEMLLQIREVLTPEQRAKFDFSPGHGKKRRGHHGE